MHYDIHALVMQSEVKKGEESVTYLDPAPSWQWLDTALMMAHGSALLVLTVYNEVAKLGMDQEIEAAHNSFTKAWQKPRE